MERETNSPSPKRRKLEKSKEPHLVKDRSQSQTYSASSLTNVDEQDPPSFAGKGLTSDAHISTEKVQASQLAKQPVNIWYGQGKDECGKDDLNEPDTDPCSVDHTSSNGSKKGDEEILSMKRDNRECIIHHDDLQDNESSVDAGFVGDRDDTLVMPPIMLGGFPPLPPAIPTGKNTTVAVLDSGINIQHSAFQVGAGNKISLHSKCFTGQPEDDFTDNLGHGTQCAGLLCGSEDIIQLHGSDETVTFRGIAPDARVMVCKVVRGGTEIADIQAVCNAIDHVIAYNRSCDDIRDKVNVISLSFGMEGFDHTLTNKIQEAVYDNIIVICAASNNGRRVRQPITYPASLGHVLCIGACTENGKPADFSPVGRELDFLANGEGVWAPTVGGDRAYCIVNGTSFATPLVAGLVCQLIEDLRRLSASEGQPDLWQRVHNVWCMRELLKEMAAVQGKHSEESGFGALNPLEYFHKEDREKLRIITKKILMQ